MTVPKNKPVAAAAPPVDAAHPQTIADDLAATILRALAESNATEQQKVYAATEALAQMLMAAAAQGSVSAQDAIRRQMLFLGSAVKHVATRMGPQF